MSTNFRIMVFLIVAIFATIPSPIKAINPRKLDETTNPAGSPNGEVKCGNCPCGTTCYSSPPPPPPTPSPPPPSPPPPKKPSPTPSPKCPPPPYGGGGGGGGGGDSGGGSGQAPPDFIYASGPPGDLYPVVQNISAAYKRFVVAPASMVVFGLMGMIAFW